MGSKSFTLIELLVVIAILAILAGMLMPAVMKSMAEAEEANMRMVLRNIDLACRQYKNDWGVYPEEDNDVSAQPYTINLWGKLLTGGGSQEALSYTGVLPGGGKGPYLELEDVYIMISVVDANTLYVCDHWGRPIKYESVNWDSTDPTYNTGSFDLISYGPDGKPGKSSTDDDGVNGTDDQGEAGWPDTDDIGNWEDN